MLETRRATLPRKLMVRGMMQGIQFLVSDFHARFQVIESSTSVLWWKKTGEDGTCPAWNQRRRLAAPQWSSIMIIIFLKA